MFEKLDVLPPVKAAEQKMINGQNSKVYISQQGDPKFLNGMNELLLGAELATSLKGRYNTVMTPGGCGALRLAAETIVSAKENATNATIWFSTPTWGNHYPLLTSAGLTAKEYAYYDIKTGGVDFDAMMADLATVPAGDLVLLL